MRAPVAPRVGRSFLMCFHTSRPLPRQYLSHIYGVINLSALNPFWWPRSPGIHNFHEGRWIDVGPNRIFDEGCKPLWRGLLWLLKWLRFEPREEGYGFFGPRKCFSEGRVKIQDHTLCFYWDFLLWMLPLPAWGWMSQKTPPRCFLWFHKSIDSQGGNQGRNVYWRAWIFERGSEQGRSWACRVDNPCPPSSPWRWTKFSNSYSGWCRFGPHPGSCEWCCRWGRSCWSRWGKI